MQCLACRRGDLLKARRIAENTNNERNTMKNGKLNGKVAVVTGTSKGIGADIAKHLAAEGAVVVVNYASSKEDADRVVDEITKRGGRAIAIQANVAKKTEVTRLFSATKKALGRIDILVNNAGVYEFSPLEAITEEHFHKQHRAGCRLPRLVRFRVDYRRDAAHRRRPALTQ
jgi:NAD(P)-dependent dehydrogenase (short-subunit alcohol dehydrogenase family)